MKIENLNINCLKYFNRVHQNIDHISAKSYRVDLVMKDKTELIYSKNSTARVMPGSIVKFITLYLIFKLNLDFKIKYIIHKEDILIGSGNNLKVNDEINLKNLVKNMFFCSSNTSANILGKIIEKYSGKTFFEVVEDCFIQMNIEGMNVLNSHGLYSKEQYVTMNGFAKFMKYIVTENKIMKFLYNEYNKQYIYFKRDGVKNIITFSELYDNCIIKTGTLHPNVFNSVVLCKVKGAYIVACLAYSKNQKTREQDIESILNLVFKT